MTTKPRMFISGDCRGSDGFACNAYAHGPQLASKMSRSRMPTVPSPSKSGGPPPLGLHLVLGPTFKEIIAGARRNLAEGRLAPTVICTRKN